MSELRPLILVTNDDGVNSRGIKSLWDAARELGDVVVVAPTQEQSARSHAITIDRPLRHITHGPDQHSIDGTPADCVYLALFERRFLPRWPDIVLSGINLGTNLGTSVFYSGTVAAAREAAMRGIPAIAFSALPGTDFALLVPHVAELTRRALEHRSAGARGLLLNVNFPPTPFTESRVTRVGRQLFEERVISRFDPSGREYFWIGGRVTEGPECEGTDAHALSLGYASVTPLSLEATNPEQWPLAARIAHQELREGDEL